MAVTSNDIANQALQLVGNNAPAVTGFAPNFDSSAAGIALSKLYAPCIQTVGREFGWDFARKQVALALTGNTAPAQWSYEYGYPGNAVEVWQLLPSSGIDPNNPLPQRWAIGNAIVSGAQQRVIWSDLQNALANYNDNPNENSWDSLFREAVVRLLASELNIALAGKPDTSQMQMEAGTAFTGAGMGRQG